MKLELPYPPSGNRYWRMFRGRHVESKEAKLYKATVRWRAVQQLGQQRPLEGDVSVIATFFRPAKRGDLDNAHKVLFDALNGVAWWDDGQVAELHAIRHEDKANPRVVVQVEAL